MTFVTVQTGTWAGWPDGVTIQLETETASAVLTAARDYQIASGHDLKGDYAVLPVGGLRTMAEVVEMQWAFDNRGTVQSNALYVKYNMDPASQARPSTTSPHMTGHCCDIADNGFLAWLKAGNAKRYGLVFTLSPPLSTLNDLRHTQYSPGTATVALDVHPLDNTTRDERPTMYLRRLKTGTIALFNGTGEHDFVSADQYIAHRNILSSYNAQQSNAADQQVVPPEDLSQVMGLDETGWGVAVAMYAAPLAASGPVDLAPILAAVAALDKQDDDYQVRLETLLKQGLTGTITIAPKA